MPQAGAQKGQGCTEWESNLRVGEGKGHASALQALLPRHPVALAFQMWMKCHPWAWSLFSGVALVDGQSAHSNRARPARRNKREGAEQMPALLSLPQVL